MRLFSWVLLGEHLMKAHASPRCVRGRQGQQRKQKVSTKADRKGSPWRLALDGGRTRELELAGCSIESTALSSPGLAVKFEGSFVFVF